MQEAEGQLLVGTGQGDMHYINLNVNSFIAFCQAFVIANQLAWGTPLCGCCHRIYGQKVNLSLLSGRSVLLLASNANVVSSGPIKVQSVTDTLADPRYGYRYRYRYG